MRWIVVIFIFNLIFWVGGDQDITNWLQSVVELSHQNIGWHSRSKRSLFDFQGVIQCIQPWASIISTYADYGCYCGYKGHGRPLDDTDKCCYYHDKCYDDNGALLDSYLTGYSYDCTNNRVVCREDLNTDHQQSFCECDRQAAECFLSGRRSYTPKLYNINTRKYCGDKADFQDLHTDQHILSKLYTCQLHDDQNKCCVDQGYNSAYHKCCNGNLWPLPPAGIENMRCCEKTLYDTRLKICCFGFLHRNFPHIQCCGNDGQKVDLRMEKCVNGKPELLADKEN